MPPPTRREQLQLDELLSDIYRGIETLPDNKTTTNHYRAAARTLYQPTSNKSSSELGGVRIKEYNVKEYEVPASSPLVKQHKQELAALRQQQADNNYSTNSNYSVSPALRQSQQPQRSTLKRYTNTSTPDQQQQSQQEPQSLASIVTSTTPEIRRRVRIVEHPDKLAKSTATTTNINNNNNNYDSSSGEEEFASLTQQQQQQQGTRQNPQQKPAKVKYVNTNKLIYHQEREPGEEEEEDEDDDNELESDSDLENNNNNKPQSDDDEDIDGVTRVEYYHTTWLDRQLGRASKRRKSKELTEREIKEKAMIEELKRSLKNGAITLRQSFKGKNKNNSSHNKQANKHSETFDDQMLNSPLNNKYNNNNNTKHSSSSVFGSGLATIPRNYHFNEKKSKGYKIKGSGSYISKVNEPVEEITTSSQHYSSTETTPRQTNTAANTSDYLNTHQQPVGRATTANGNQFMPSMQSNRQQADSTTRPSILQQTTNNNLSPAASSSSNYNSKTLPHNFNQQPRKVNEHQLLQSHYRASHLANKPFTTQQQQNNYNTVDNSSRQPPPRAHTNNYSQPQPQQNNENMRNPLYSNTNNNFISQSSTLGRGNTMKSPTGGETIGSLPSSTDVVRSALSRSNSQASIVQLNKTINLLPTTPSPYAPSPMTPTQQLKAASPSFTPSPLPNNPRSPQPAYQRQPAAESIYNNSYSNYGSKTLGHEKQQQSPIRLQGTRIVESKPAQPQQQQQQPVYANPHASLMQHKAEQQMRQPGRNNTSSLREFNELDSLLRSLSPGSAPTATSTTQITPGYSSKPAQQAFGFGFNPNQQQQQPLQPAAPTRVNNSDMYARVQKQPAATNDHSKASYLQQHYGTGHLGSNQPYTIDVTDKKTEEACLQRQKHQQLSEFEPPVDLLLPSMEDYQNITRLNPVKNHYWYKPNMSRDRAISLLKDKPQGTFIVRDSTSFRGSFGLAVKVAKLPKNVLNNASLRNPNGDPSSELIRHFLIERTSNGVRLKGYANESVYGSLPALIYQHSLTELALPCRLVIPRADIEDPNFNQKQKQYYDEFIASKEQTKHYPYDRTTTPNGGYRKYPGDVYIHNEHRIIFE